ncbi:MAG: hypothetical protein K2R93_19155 [Gemmatimonadaceae bacterium]|nr:hypothetical protein [Gemmatimonadaceae bacterium]
MATPLPIVDAVPANRWWRVAQGAVWLVGLIIYLSLFVRPALGLALFWNVLIPVAPALLVVAVGVWRNVCPMASVTLLPRHLGVSQQRIMPPRVQARLQLVGVCALFLIVPLRHAIFNTDGPATGVLITALALTGIVMGARYEWKSAWCSTLCPVHPVERLYGNNVLAPMANAHCAACRNCVVPCPDSTPNMLPHRGSKFTPSQVAAVLVTGGLPGFVWGWFQVPDAHDLSSATRVLSVYAMPMLGLTLSVGVYLALLQWRRLDETILGRVFATAAVSCYYAYRIPSLVGYGARATDGVLVDLHGVLPAWGVWAAVTGATAFFAYWILVRPPNAQSWVTRPAYAGRSDR